MLDDELSVELLEKLTYALRDTNAIPAYVFNVIEPLIEPLQAVEQAAREYVEARPPYNTHEYRALVKALKDCKKGE
jgi:hypothetical protein